jgi:hypothetical protein
VTPSFLDLVPEQHQSLFPRKRDKTGKLTNTSKTEWAQDAAGHRVEHTIVRRALDVTGITIHQTACVFGPLDNVAKRHRRALKVPAHVVAFRDGVFAQSAPLRWFLYHGNALNDRTLGLECEGHYPGLLDDPTTPRREDEESIWGDSLATPLDDVALVTFREGLRHLVVEGRKLGMPLRWIWAHRQSSESRRSDPGEELWQRVVLEFAVPVLGLQTGVNDTFRDGRPIPAAWDPSATAPY